MSTVVVALGIGLLILGVLIALKHDKNPNPQKHSWGWILITFGCSILLIGGGVNISKMELVNPTLVTTGVTVFIFALIFSAINAISKRE